MSGERSHITDADYRAALIYPDTYEIGQANQAIAILYSVLNGLTGVAAERAYLPWIDMSALMREEGVPLFSLESCAPVCDFDLVGITLPYELSFSNVLETLDLAGIPLRTADRREGDPLVIGGGPSAFNPEPVSAFFDAILIGEGEEAVAEIVATHRAAKADGAARAEILKRLAQVKGVYVPSLYTERLADGVFVGVDPAEGAPAVVTKRVVADFDALAPPACGIVPFMDVVHDRLGIEVLRGCTRGCRFCQAGMVYRPVRERSADSIVRGSLAGLACTGYDEVSLTSLSTTDHSQLEEVLRRLSRRLAGSGVSVSLPSLRVDAFGVEMARLVSAGGKKSGLTFAPEAGTQRMRDVVNKNVTEDDLLGSVQRAFEAGWRRVKLYFMIGLPTETDADVVGIGELVSRVLAVAKAATPANARGSVRVAVSVSTFVPKAHTPFQWEAQIGARRSPPPPGPAARIGSSQGSRAALARLRRLLPRGCDGARRPRAGRRDRDRLASRRAVRRVVGVLPAADMAGRPCRERRRSRGPGQPRRVRSTNRYRGITCRPASSRAYLVAERELALAAAVTPDCSFDGCTGCDVCADLGVDIRLAGASRG